MRRLYVEINAVYDLDEEDNAMWDSMTREERLAKRREIEEGARRVITANMDEGTVVTASARMAVHPE